MIRVKNIAVFLIILFCAKVVMADNGFRNRFMANDFKIVSPWCQNSNDAQDNHKDVQESSATPVVTLLINCHETFIVTKDYDFTDTLKTLTLIDYFHKVKFKAGTVMDRPFPPPKEVDKPKAVKLFWGLVKNV